MNRKISNKALSEKAATLQALQAEAAQLQDQIDALKREITSELTRREAEELKAGNFLIRWTRYLTSRLDTKALKADYPDIADTYTRQTEARRFSIATAN